MTDPEGKNTFLIKCINELSVLLKSVVEWSIVSGYIFLMGDGRMVFEELTKDTGDRWERKDD